jgi:hypothetical protein
MITIEWWLGRTPESGEAMLDGRQTAFFQLKKDGIKFDDLEYDQAQLSEMIGYRKERELNVPQEFEDALDALNTGCEVACSWQT